MFTPDLYVTRSAHTYPDEEARAVLLVGLSVVDVEIHCPFLVQARDFLNKYDMTHDVRLLLMKDKH